MSATHQLLMEHIDIWTATDTEKKSGRGRSAGNAASVYGIKKLRELILELAVRGKLVPQDPKDEPASELLKGIQAEKTNLIAEGKIKINKSLSAITDSEKPFLLPKAWEWVRLEDLMPEFQNGASSRGDSDGVSVVVLRLADIKERCISLEGPRELLISPNMIDKYRLLIGDVLVVRVNGSADLVGGFVVCEKAFDGIYCDHFIRMRISQSILIPKFIALVGASQLVRNRIKNLFITTAGQKTVNQGHICSLIIPLLSVAEQYRIVAKVDELMALCDQLETQHTNAFDAHEKLVSHLLGTLTQSQSAEDFSASWQRIAAHFDTLFTTEASIDALKQTLLQLAMMGKLVPQDSSDEPASELLKRIQAEKAKLIDEGKIKKEKPLLPITDGEKPFCSPEGWAWVRLNDLLNKIGAGSTPLGGKQAYVNEGIPFLRSQNVWNEGLRLDDVAFIEEKTHQRMSGTHVYPSDLLFNITGASIGRCAIVPDTFATGNVSQHVTIVRPVSKEILRFLHLVLISRHIQKTVLDVQVGVSREGLSIGKLGQFIIPFPPLSEQHRIVAKVDDLMALCDQLKSRITEANHLQQKLANVMVEQAVA
jgi:type I restriction enzyme S subunit